MAVVVRGAAGFIGRHVVSRIRRRGIPVVGIDRLSWAPSAGEVAIAADLADPIPPPIACPPCHGRDPPCRVRLCPGPTSRRRRPSMARQRGRGCGCAGHGRALSGWGVRVRGADAAPAMTRDGEAGAAPRMLRLWYAMLAAGLIAVAASAVGVPTRATYGARTTADEPQYLLTALSLAEDGDLDISDELDAERWRVFHEAELPRQTRPLPGGRHVSPHDPLLAAALAPAMAVGGWIAAKWTLVLLAGALAALLVWTAAMRLAVRPLTAALVVSVLAASVPLAPYGSQIYPELPAALAVTVGVAALLAPLGRFGGAAVGVVCCALPWLGIKYAPVAGVLAAFALIRLWRDGRRSALAALAGGLAIAGVVYIVVHQSVWTGWTVYASADHFVESGELGVIGFSPDYGARSIRLAALLTERSFGIAAWQPAWLLAVPALGALVNARPPGWTVLSSVLTVGWCTATFVALTMAGWWFPGRQVVVVLPAAVLILCWWLDRVSAARRAFGVLGVLGIVSWLWLAIEASTGRLTLIVDLMDTTNPWYRMWRTALPDFLAVTAGTWVRHAVWCAALLGLAAVGWRSTTTEPDVRSGA